MAPSRRTLANRQNAKRSTGPRTEAGKARVAKNAIRHGLAVPASLLPEAQGVVAALADAIAGETSDPVKRELARRVAEAQFEASHARQARHDQVQIPLDPYDLDFVRFRRDGKKAMSRVDPAFTDRWLIAAIRINDPNLLTAEDLLPETIIERAAELNRIYRYERRALSQRRRAIRDFDAYTSAEQPDPTE